MPLLHPDPPEIDGLKARKPEAPASAWSPLKIPVFRLLWGTWVTANICMWMSDVAAAWMMTSLTSSPIWVALVQTAATLPVFLLGLPSGALADILDRRRYFIVTQFWLAGTAAVLCVAVLFNLITPPLLLALTFANGIGLAMRWPVFAALIPEIVPRQQLPAALALNGVAMNASRIIGPIVAGALIASAGTAYVFVLNATLSVMAGFVVMRWRREHVPSPLGRERLFSAMRVGLQFVRESAPLRGVFLRVTLFFFHSTALLALLPLLARRLAGGDAATYTLLLAAMGAGAIVTTTVLPRLRQLLPSNQLVLAGTLLQSLTTLAMAFAPNVYVAVPGHDAGRHVLAVRRQHFERFCPDDAAGLGARARHVDVPDGHHGWQCPGCCDLGPAGHNDHAHEQSGGRSTDRRHRHAGCNPQARRPRAGRRSDALTRVQSARGTDPAARRTSGGHH